MAGVNKAIIVGNLGQAVDFRTLQNGEGVATISVATSESWQDKRTGEKRESTEWHRIVLYRRLAEIARDYLAKGSKVYAEGKLQTRKWTDDKGVERYLTEIIANSLQMLSGNPNKQTEQSNAPQKNAYAAAKGGQPQYDEAPW